jgi:hypothetical protein
MQVQVDKSKIIKQAEKNRLKQLQLYSPEQIDEIVNDPDYISDTGKKYAALGAVVPVIAASAIAHLGDDSLSDYSKPLLSGLSLASTGIGYLTGRQIANQRLHDARKIQILNNKRAMNSGGYIQ